MKKFIFFLLVLILLPASDIHAFSFLNIWRHPEIAGKNSLFVDAGVSINFSPFGFNVLPVDIRIDYMLPLPLPFFAGVFLRTPNPNLKNFGFRTGYHFDFGDPFTDFYVFYSFDFGFIRNDLLKKYNDTPVPFRFFDFRIGFRRFFGAGARFGLCVESGYQFKSVVVLISIKIL